MLFTNLKTGQVITVAEKDRQLFERYPNIYAPYENQQDDPELTQSNAADEPEPTSPDITEPVKQVQKPKGGK